MELNKKFAKLLLSCVGKPGKYSLDHVLFQDGKLVATDGRKMAVIEANLKMEGGLYLLKGNQLYSPMSDLRFPNWKELSIPPEPIEILSKTGTWINQLQWALGKHRIPLSINDNIKTLKAAEQITSNWELSHTDGEVPVYLHTNEGGNLFTIVMMSFSPEE